MKKSLVLAEKPSVGRDIARVLKCAKKGDGYIEGDQYIVTWALGHLVTLKQPEMYDQKFKSWDLQDLPMLPKQLDTMVIKKTGRQFNTVKRLVNRNDVGEIIIATDAGREGELVARWIFDNIKHNLPMKRLWISSVTDQAIKAGFSKLKLANQYENLYYAAVARSEADWYVGLNATRALTTKHNASLNCGRVQTPTLKLIALREKSIREFKPKIFYTLDVEAGDVVYQWHNQNERRIFDKNRAEQLEKKLHGELQINHIDKKIKTSYPQALYDLTMLQRDANVRYGMSASETLRTMQTLYERHKAVTYPRTDSRYLSSDMVSTLGERVKACGIGDYRKVGQEILRSGIKARKSFVDDKKVSDHHAIIPTEESVIYDQLNANEKRIYTMVVERFLEVLMPPYEYETITIEASAEGETLKATGNRTIKLGFKALSSEARESGLPDVKKDDRARVTSVNLHAGETSAPKHFTEATLLQAMENPAQFMQLDDKSSATTLKETGGLGTVATRADIIDKLFNSFMMEKQGNSIRLTSKGRQLLDLAPSALTSPETTAKWETQLEKIGKGQLKRAVFIDEIKNYTREMVTEIKESDAKFKHDNLSGRDCPDCGKPMLEVNGKKGKMLVCQDRECGHRKNIARTTNARCPKCKKKLTLSGEGDGQMFTCVCGHREKLSSFKARRDKAQKGKVDKRTVKKYVGKSDENINSALADQLKGLKF